MTNTTHTPGPWLVSKSRPAKQSNFGVYKQSISTGEGMGLRRVTITGDTPEVVQEVAINAAAAPELLDALKAYLKADTETDGIKDWAIAKLKARSAIAKATGGAA